MRPALEPGRLPLQIGNWRVPRSPAYPITRRTFSSITSPALGGKPDDLVGHLAILEKQQCGNAADVIARWCRAVLIHVHLGHLDLSRVRFGHLVHVGRNGPARAAPCSPEVHQHRLLAAQHFLVEICIRYFQHTRSRHVPPCLIYTDSVYSMNGMRQGEGKSQGVSGWKYAVRKRRSARTPLRNHGR